MRTRALLPIALAAACDACGAPPRASPATRPPPSPGALASAATPPAAPPPIVSPARWIAATQEVAFSRPMFGTTLYFGGDGARWAGFARPADPVELGLSPEPIVAAFPYASGLAMVGTSSAAYVAKTPLGPAVERRPPRLGGPVVPGRAAAFMIAGGALLRFADPAVGWAPVPLPLDGRALTQVAAAPDGKVLALAAPQRTFVSGDDGARFDRAPAPLAIQTLALRNGTIAVDGLERRGPSALVGPLTHAASYSLVGDPPHFEVGGYGGYAGRPTGRAQAPTGLAHAAAGPRGGFLDARWLELLPLGRAARLLSRPLDGTRTPALVQVVDACEEPLLATRAPRTLAIACRDGARTRLLRSEDEGAHLETIATVDGGVTALVVEARSLLFAACAANGASCEPRLARVGRGPIEPLSIAGDAADFEALGAILAIDDADGRALAIGRAKGGVAIGQIERSGLVQRAIVPWTEARSLDAVRLGLADGELVSIAARAPSGWLLFRRTPQGFAPATLPGPIDGLGVTGRRALAWTTRRLSWESDDAGATWTALDAPTLGADGLCGAHGCVFDGFTTRLGWSLPGATPRLAPSSRARTARHARGLRCQPSGPPIPLGRPVAPLDVEAAIDLDGGVRFARPVRDDARALFVASARGAALTKTKLLDGATSTGASPLGVAAARLDRDPKTRKLTASLAWWSPRGGAAATTYAAQYGLAAVGPTTRGAWLLEGGKLRLFPSAGAPRELAYGGASTALAFVDGDPKAPLVLATDGRYALASDGAALAPVAGALPSAVDATGLLGAFAPAPSVPFARVRALGADPAAAFALTLAANAAVPAATLILGRPSADPESTSIVRGPTALDLAEPGRACGAGAATGGLRLVLPPTRGARRAVRVVGAGPDGVDRVLASGDEIARVDAKGGACLSTLVAEDAATHAVIGLADLAHAWLLQDERGLLSARPLSCAWSDEPLPASLRDVEGFYEEAFVGPTP